MTVSLGSPLVPLSSFVLILAASLLAVTAPTAAQRPPSPRSPDEAAALLDEMEDRHISWLRRADPLITHVEGEAFLELKRDHHRDAFIRKFWQVRDPYPQTGRNELKERWDERVYIAESEYETLDDDRARVFLVHGEPHRTLEVRCTTTRMPVIVWQYRDSDVARFPFLLVFVRQAGLGRARIWRPGLGNLERIARNAKGCLNGNRMDDILTTIRNQGASYDISLDRALAKPRPQSEEWIATFHSFSTELPEGAKTLEAEIATHFLGRVQSRTVVQTTFQVPLEEATLEEFAGFESYNFEVNGEILQEGQLFENFRYKFGLAKSEAPPSGIPMAYQRYLRPGPYVLIHKVHDLNGNAFFIHEAEIDVPRMEEIAEIPDDRDNETMQLFREASEAVGSEETAIRLVAPPGDLHQGFVRFDTLTSGSNIERVVFSLDERTTVTRNNPPWNVEIDLGPFPRLRNLRASALDADGKVVAEDELLVNAGEHRFGVRLVEPFWGREYDDSVRARAEVDLPKGRTLERVEFFLNERLVATLFQEPFVQPIRLANGGAPAYIRTVAHLVDGNSTEDVAFINAPDVLEEMDIQFVELYAAVRDTDGRPVEDLAERDFRIFEDGVEQTINRFDRVENLPFHAVILIDNSASMGGALGQARHAALRFFEQAVTPKDRAAIITFNRFPNIAVEFTNEQRALGAGLQGLTAEGQTALYDSMMFTLYYFTGIKGQRAILLLSDGKDEVSRFDFSETLDYARRAGVTIYSIGLNMDDGGARRRLITLANQTGGRSYFIKNVDDLSGVYALVQQDLRAQYLIAYQSTNTSSREDFRYVDLEVKRPRTTVRTLAGYYP
ncbi:MAG: VWA domain-containing protein [Acidobacteriota bacterium]|nr:VWA domain-containing protein [Acidobacteriota bacterium]